MRIKYQAEDGKLFDEITECREYEMMLSLREAVGENPFKKFSLQWMKFEARKAGFDSVEEWYKHEEETADHCLFCGMSLAFGRECGCEKFAEVLGES